MNLNSIESLVTVGSGVVTIVTGFYFFFGWGRARYKDWEKSKARKLRAKITEQMIEERNAMRGRREKDPFYFSPKRKKEPWIGDTSGWWDGWR